jgi:hypothetical protein
MNQHLGSQKTSPESRMRMGPAPEQYGRVPRADRAIGQTARNKPAREPAKAGAPAHGMETAPPTSHAGGQD